MRPDTTWRSRLGVRVVIVAPRAAGMEVTMDEFIRFSGAS
jgi:hypothetical protein